jgi:hypothetical protein
VFVDVAVLDDERGRISHRISGDTRIRFRGSGRARFRQQHTGTYDGGPDSLMWCEVSAMSDARLADPRDALDSDGVTVIGGALVDVVDGDTDVLYRRHSADFVRVVPLDAADGEIESDPENFTACLKYEIAIEPIA